MMNDTANFQLGLTLKKKKKEEEEEEEESSIHKRTKALSMYVQDC